MSELRPSVLPLDKGLDLQTAKIIAPPGSVLDSVNYEQVDFQGQKRIEGYNRYDGSALAAIDEYYVVTFKSDVDISAGDLLLKDNAVFGVVAENDSGQVYYIRINEALTVKEDTSVTRMTTGGDTEVYTVDTNLPGKEVQTVVQDHYNKLLEVMSTIRANVGALPGSIAGLHWFKDRLYAVGDITFAILTDSTLLYPNDVVEINGTFYNVYDSFYLDNSQMILLQSTEESFVGQDVYRDGNLIGTVVDEGHPDDLPKLATIFESRSEQQVLREDSPTSMDFGWRAKHLGWVVYFEDGIALYGTLASVNQNRQNVGIEGPTSDDGANGSPAVLVQRVALTNGPTQVNGWKSSDTPTNYILDATDVQLLDTKFTYADAFISWTANSSAVSTPGSDMVGLVEYSPTSTIRYTTL